MLLAAVATVSAVALTLTNTTAAQATPSKEELLKQINTLGKKVTVADEKYNQAREKLKRTKAKAAKLNKQLKPLQDKVDVLYETTGKIAAAAYKGGQASAVNAVLTSGSPDTLVDQLATLDVLAGKQNKEIGKLSAAKSSLDKKKEALDKLLSEQAKIQKDLGAKKRQIEGQLKKLKAMYVEAYGPLYTGGGGGGNYGPPPYVGGKAQRIVNFAYAQLGKPYEFGAAGPDSWDCSGLTMGAYQQVGVSLPHSAHEQYNATARVARGDIKPGDLIFYYSDLHHVAVYIGGGTVIHAPQPGENVKKSSVDAMPFAGAGRASY
jgi:cell wall-associated NlpC family hydrolase